MVITAVQTSQWAQYGYYCTVDRAHYDDYCSVDISGAGPLWCLLLCRHVSFPTMVIITV